MESTSLQKKKLQFPNTYVLLFIVCIIMVVLSYVVPAGAFERVLDETTGRTIVVPGTFHLLEESTPASLYTFLNSFYQGFMQCVDIFALILITGMCMGVIMESGALQAGIGIIIKKLGKDKIDLMIVLLVIVIALASSIVGMFDPLIVFLPLILTICRTMKYDVMTGCALLILGCYSAFGFTLISPFSLVIAQQIAEVPIFSGMGLRVAGTIGAIIITAAYILWYGRRCAKDHSKSYLYSKETGGYIVNCELLSEGGAEIQDVKMTGKQKALLVILLVMCIILGYGAIVHSWGMAPMSALFLATAIVAGIVQFGWDYNGMVDCFIANAKPLLSTGLLMGMSRAVLFIMSEAQIMDTIIYAISIPLSYLKGPLSGWGMYISQLIVNVFVPSSSGQAVVVMPIMTPLSDLMNIPRNVAVHAYMAGDCFGNLITPTHPMTLAVLGLAGIPWTKWFKFAWKVVVLYSLLTFAILTVGYYVW